ncbi:MAG: hypothetical protein K2M76_06150 [Muribaculaceae bacterium]|nr:hypothetical protein [Muribaculaceae bacterium]
MMQTVLRACFGFEALYILYFWIVAGGDWKAYIPLTDWRQIAFVTVACVYEALYAVNLIGCVRSRKWPELDFGMMFFVANIVVLWVYASVA